VEGKIPKAFNPNKSAKSRGLDLRYASAIVSEWKQGIWCLGQVTTKPSQNVYHIESNLLRWALQLLLFLAFAFAFYFLVTSASIFVIIKVMPIFQGMELG
jgi:hypothetical protein